MQRLGSRRDRSSGFDGRRVSEPTAQICLPTFPQFSNQPLATRNACLQLILHSRPARDNSVAKRASSRMSHVLLLATESLPKPTTTPASINFANGARRDRVSNLTSGNAQCSHPLLRTVSISLSSTRMQWANRGFVSRMPTCFK